SITYSMKGRANWWEKSHADLHSQGWNAFTIGSFNTIRCLPPRSSHSTTCCRSLKIKLTGQMAGRKHFRKIRGINRAHPARFSVAVTFVRRRGYSDFYG